MADQQPAAKPRSRVRLIVQAVFSLALVVVLFYPKEKPGFWTHRRAFEQVRRGSNIHLLPYSLVAWVL